MSEYNRMVVIIIHDIKHTLYFFTCIFIKDGKATERCTCDVIVCEIVTFPIACGNVCFSTYHDNNATFIIYT